MMKIQSIIKRLLSAVVLCATLAACSEDAMDNINENTSNPEDVQAKYIMTDVMTSTAFNLVGGNFNTYLSLYIEHETGVYEQFYKAERRDGDPSTASTFSNEWGSAYSTLKDAKISIDKCGEGGEEEGSPTLGVAQFFAAYDLALITDMFGDTPWKEACDQMTYKTPVIDKQEDIYKDIMAYVDGAITNLQKSPQSDMATQDYIYGGDNTKWLKAAYALKARLTMRLINKSSNVQADMQTVLDCVSKSFTSAGEECSFNVYTGSNKNPMFATFQSREGTSASKSMHDRLVAYGDPRVSRCYINPKDCTVISSADDKLINLPPNGDPVQQKNVYTQSTFVYGQTASTHLISYHEILFLKAEALYRLNRLDEAKAALKEAVVAGFANTEKNISAALSNAYYTLKSSTTAITPEQAAAYFDSSVAKRFDADPLKEIMIQKYIAFWGTNGESVEAYNDIRRMKAMGTDVYGLKNPNKFPLRLPYGGGDTTANPNVQEAYGDGSYVYKENVWWAGGTR